MSDRTRPRSGLLLLAEAALCTLHLSVAVGFARLYEDWSFAPDLLIAVLTAHAAAAISRRRLGAPMPVVVAVPGAALVLAWCLFPDTTAFGLPTPDTWNALTSALAEARIALREVVAPTEPTVGFQAATMIALWVSVWFADWAAFRLRATIEPLAPAAVIFTFVTILGSGAHRILSATMFAAAALGFLCAHRAMRAHEDDTWLDESAGEGPVLVLRAGVTVAALAVVAGSLVGTRLPGSDGTPVIDWRRRGNQEASDRTTVSPIVDLRRRLVAQSDALFFTVRADRPSYWRLTALDEFDGRIWKIDKEFESADRNLPDTGPIRQGRPLRQSFSIESLDDLWVPAAFEARTILESSEKLRWDADTSTLIVDRSAESTAGMSYTVESVTPTFTEMELRTDRSPAGRGLQEMLALPPSFPRVVADTARLVTRSTESEFDVALALQNWFRAEFEYSTDVESGHGDDALVEFLADRRGYCEQFAGAFAAMARSLGVPARVAVGFTPGALNPRTGRLEVRGRHAHAWPEVWFPSYGWVPFEPTPGRGIPGAQSYTGVDPEQDESAGPAEPATTTTSTTSATTSTSTLATPTTTTIPTPAAGIDARPSSRSRGSGGWGGDWTKWVAATALLLVAWPAVLALVARRRSRGRQGAVGEILTTWQRVVTAIRRASGPRPTRSETYEEFARRGAREYPDLGEHLVELGELVSLAAWGPNSLRPADVDRASALGESIRTALDGRRGRWNRFTQSMSLREAIEGR